MRIVTWNCGGGFHKKAQRIVELKPHIAVIQEVLEADAQALGLNYKSKWIGQSGRKGMLIACAKNLKIEIIAKSVVKYFVRFRVSSNEITFDCIGVWSLPEKRNYVQTVCEGMDEIMNHGGGRGYPFLILGDFNASPKFDDHNTQMNKFVRILNATKRHGLDSLWHKQKNETYGLESMPTFYHQYNESKPFHIDYMFGCQRVVSALDEVEVGHYADWCKGGSDHMPVIADLKYL